MWGLVHSVCRIVNMIIINQIGKENKNNKKRTRKQERVRKHNTQGAWNQTAARGGRRWSTKLCIWDQKLLEFFSTQNLAKSFCYPKRCIIIISNSQHPTKPQKKHVHTHTHTHRVSILLLRKSPSSSVCFLRRKTKQGSSSHTKQTKEQQEEMGLSRAQTNPTPNKIPHSLQ
jgi:hypothetical protein